MSKNQNKNEITNEKDFYMSLSELLQVHQQRQDNFKYLQEIFPSLANNKYEKKQQTVHLPQSKSKKNKIKKSKKQQANKKNITLMNDTSFNNITANFVSNLNKDPRAVKLIQQEMQKNFGSVNMKNFPSLISKIPQMKQIYCKLHSAEKIQKQQTDGIKTTIITRSFQYSNENEIKEFRKSQKDANIDKQYHTDRQTKQIKMKFEKQQEKLFDSFTTNIFHKLEDYFDSQFDESCTIKIFKLFIKIQAQWSNFIKSIKQNEQKAKMTAQQQQVNEKRLKDSFVYVLFSNFPVFEDLFNMINEIELFPTGCPEIDNILGQQNSIYAGMKYRFQKECEELQQLDITQGLNQNQIRYIQHFSNYSHGYDEDYLDGWKEVSLFRAQKRVSEIRQDFFSDPSQASTQATQKKSIKNKKRKKRKAKNKELKKIQQMQQKKLEQAQTIQKVSEYLQRLDIITDQRIECRIDQEWKQKFKEAKIKPVHIVPKQQKQKFKFQNFQS